MAKRAAKKESFVSSALSALAALDGGIPPIFLRHHFYNDPHEPLLPRGALTNGRTVVDAFGELAKEGKAVLHQMFRRGASEQLRGASVRQLVAAKKWAGFLEELEGITMGKRNTYGATLDRTRRTWMKYTVRINTEEEAAHERIGYGPSVEHLLAITAKWYRTHCEKEGMDHNPTPAALQRFRVEQFLLPDLSEKMLADHYRTHPLPAWYAMGTTSDGVEIAGPEEPITPPLEYIRPDLRERIPRDQLFSGWLEEYAAEVEVAAGRFTDDPELPHAFAGLVDELRKFRPATYQAKGLRAELEGMADGAGFLGAMDRERERLVRRLERIAEEHMATTANTQQGAEPIQWKGTIQQLAWVLRELAEKGWIGYPAQKGDTTKWKAGDINASAFAKAMAPHFGDVNERTLAQELKKEGGTVPALDVEGWAIPKRPE